MTGNLDTNGLIPGDIGYLMPDIELDVEDADVCDPSEFEKECRVAIVEDSDGRLGYVHVHGRQFSKPGEKVEWFHSYTHTSGKVYRDWKTAYAAAVDLEKKMLAQYRHSVGLLVAWAKKHGIPLNEDSAANPTEKDALP